MTITNESSWGSAGRIESILTADETLLVPKTLDRETAGVFEIDPLIDPRWETFVQHHSQTSVFHSTNWIRALKSVYGYRPVVFTTSPPGSPLTNGIAVCRIKSWLSGSRLVSLPFSDHCEPLVRNADEFDDLLLSMRRYVDVGWSKYAEVRPVSFEPRQVTKYTRHLSYCFHRIDLTPRIEEVFRSFHKDCVQRKIRRAEKEKLTYEEGTSDSLLQKFYRLMVMTRRRQSLPPQPLAWFRGLIGALGSDLKIRVASVGDVPVASILTLSHKMTVTYKYGCSDTAFNKFGGMALLFWKTIQEAKSAGYTELDMGRSDCDNLGLIAFKNHWGARSTVLTYWTYSQQPAPSCAFWQHRMVKQAISAAPPFVLKAAGNLLYKHIG